MMTLPADLKRISCLTVLAFGLISGCATSTSERPGEEFLISQKGIGSIKLGMTPGEVKRNLRTDYRLVPPAKGNTVELAAWYRVLDANDSEVWRFFVENWQRPTDQNRIIQVQTTNKSFRTGEGLGPGSSIARAQSVWGRTTLRRNLGVAGVESLSFAKQPAYYLFTARGIGADPAGIYGSLAPQNFMKGSETQDFWPGAQIRSVTVRAVKPLPVPKVSRPKPTASPTPSATPQMRARVGGVIFE